MTSHTIIPSPGTIITTDFAADADVLALVEQELGRACDDPDEFEAALFHYGLAA
ncbi:MAG: hypothetical protein KDB06_14125 [Ilumatobacter sp.]|nr:hypothetical protein [Ilumatobacter sp.]MCB0985783.1 hypothetical protein [Ilumatobacter sp.]